MNYMVIISQQYYSRHCFIVIPDKDTFYQKAKSLILDLEIYKREPIASKEPNYGDFCEKYYHGIDTRSNVNDKSGDIYFIPANSIEQVLEVVKENWLDEVEAPKSFKKKKQVVECLQKHHGYTYIKKIVAKHFDIL